jgi:hypothetical protein
MTVIAAVSAGKAEDETDVTGGVLAAGEQAASASATTARAVGIERDGIGR